MKHMFYATLTDSCSCRPHAFDKPKRIFNVILLKIQTSAINLKSVHLIHQGSVQKNKINFPNVFDTLKSVRTNKPTSSSWGRWQV